MSTPSTKPTTRRCELGRIGQRPGDRLPDPEPAVRPLSPRRRHRTGGSAWRSATRCSTCARAGLIDTDDMNRLMRLAPRGARARCAQALSRGPAQRQRRARRAFATALVPQARGRDGPAVRDRRLHRLLHQHPPRHRRSASSSGPTTRCCRTTSGCRSATTAAPRRSIASGATFRRPVGQTKARATARRPSCRPTRAARLRARARRLHRPAECAWASRSRSARPRSTCSAWPCSTTGRARDIQAWEYQPLGPVPVEELRQHDLALDRDAGRAGAVPRAVRAARRRPAAAALPRLGRQPRATARSTSSSRSGCRPRRCARRATPATGSCRSNFARRLLDGRRSWSRTTRSTAATCVNGDLFGSGTLSGPRPEQAGSLLELTEGGKQPIALSNGETRTFLEDGDTRRSCAGCCERDGLPPHRLRRVPRHGAAGREAKRRERRQDRQRRRGGPPDPQRRHGRDRRLRRHRLRRGDRGRARGAATSSRRRRARPARPHPGLRRRPGRRQARAASTTSAHRRAGAARRSAATGAWCRSCRSSRSTTRSRPTTCRRA